MNNSPKLEFGQPFDPAGFLFWKKRINRYEVLAPVLAKDAIAGASRVEHFKVLDLGCGDLELTIPFSRILSGMVNELTITLVDKDPMMSSSWERSLQDEFHCSWIGNRMDLRCFSSDLAGEGYDAIICSHVLYHLPRISQLEILDGVRKFLRPNGKLFVVLRSRLADWWKTMAGWAQRWEVFDSGIGYDAEEFNEDFEVSGIKELEFSCICSNENELLRITEFLYRMPINSILPGSEIAEDLFYCSRKYLSQSRGGISFTDVLFRLSPMEK